MTAEACHGFNARAVEDLHEVVIFFGGKGREDNRDRPRRLDVPRALRVGRVLSGPVSQCRQPRPDQRDVLRAVAPCPDTQLGLSNISNSNDC